MGDDSFRSVYSDILGNTTTAEGIVIDTRFNGGRTLARGYRDTFQPDRNTSPKWCAAARRATCPADRWNKPSIMVMCEANYSNCARHAVGLQPPRTGQAGRHDPCREPLDQRVVGTPARPVIGIRHPRRGLPPVGRQLSGELAAGAGHQSSQFTRDHREGRRHTAESCRRGTAEGTRKISTALPHAGIPVI